MVTKAHKTKKLTKQTGKACANKILSDQGLFSKLFIYSKDGLVQNFR